MKNNGFMLGGMCLVLLAGPLLAADSIVVDNRQAKLEGAIIVDNPQAVLEGTWFPSSDKSAITSPKYGTNYNHVSTQETHATPAAFRRC